MGRIGRTAVAAALLVGVAAFLPVFLSAPDGRPLTTPADVLGSPLRVLGRMGDEAVRQVQDLGAAVRPVGARAGEDRPDPQGFAAVVRYRDEHGNWVYANAAPEGVATEPVPLDPDDRITPLGADWAPAGPAPAAPLELPKDPVDAYGRAPELLERARAVREQLDARNRHLDELLDGPAGIPP